MLIRSRSIYGAPQNYNRVTSPLNPQQFQPQELAPSPIGSAIGGIGKAFTYGVTGTVVQAQCSLSGSPVSADPVQLGSCDICVRRVRLTVNQIDVKIDSICDVALLSKVRAVPSA